MRTYERTHPWLKFALWTSGAASADVWMLLGEAQSKCEHVAGVPLQPATAQRLHRLFLAKGVRATTAIEGNTLSEQQVLDHLEGKLQLPKSKAYLQQEIDNIVSGCNDIAAEVLKAPGEQLLEVDRIVQFNALVLRGLSLEEHIQPGCLRSYEVGVANYKAAPWADCAFLLRRLCDWLNGPEFRADPSKPDRVIVFAILKAVLAHLYLAWIHPFGDGNGRTARLDEFYILVFAGVPTPYMRLYLLSNFYNETRTEYYRQLDYASKSGGDVIPFLTYATQGFVDGLREQLGTIRNQQWHVAWENYVHEEFSGPETQTDKRQKHLVLDLSLKTEPVPRADLANVSPRLAVEYAQKGPRTLARDIRELERRGLITRSEKDRGAYVANRDKILAFLPARAQQQRQAPAQASPSKPPPALPEATATV